VGGCDLHIWKQTRAENASLELVRFLSRKDITHRILPYSLYLPPRLAELDEIAAEPGPHQAAVVQAALNGRTSPCVPMIGLLEDRLSFALLSIQQEILDNPNVNIDLLLQQRIIPLGRRTNISLSSLQ
jgi:multiple sugar transport system substrate-binding protein